MINLSLIKKGQTVAVAFSGGLDSVCLLHMLYSRSKECGFLVKAVHVNHNIRGVDSDNDQAFCENFCRYLGIELKIFSVDAPSFSMENKFTLEQGARALRYNCFNSLVDCGWCDLIATAHHAEDNFETVLHNLFRGSGLKGVSGIKQKTNAIIRPIRSFSKSKLLEYAKENGLEFCTDETNFNETYTRNYIRHKITPAVINRFPKAVTAVDRASAIFSEEDEFLDDLARSALNEKGGKITISTKTPKVLLRRAIIMALASLGVQKDYEQVHVQSVLNLLDNQSGKLVNLPKNVVAIKEYENLVFFMQSEEGLDRAEYGYKKGEFPFKNKTAVIENGSLEELKTALVFDGAKIPLSSKIRLRREGDVFEKFGGGTKKLKEFLIDKKIPLLERDNLPVIACGNKVYVVFGVAISNSVKVTDKTKRIYKASLK